MTMTMGHSIFLQSDILYCATQEVSTKTRVMFDRSCTCKSIIAYVTLYNLQVYILSLQLRQCVFPQGCLSGKLMLAGESVFYVN